MSKSASTTADKNIVDRSRTRRNKAVFDTVRATRERLQYGPVSGHAFERDMLQMHIAETLQSATIMPLFIILATGVGIYISRDPQILGWAILALTAHAITLLLARRASRLELTAANLSTWSSLFLAAQIVMGLVWVLFAFQKIEPGDPSLIMFYKGGTLLIALSITATSNVLLRRAMLMTFLPVLVALTVTAALSRSPMEIGLALMFGLSMLFCHHVTALPVQHQASVFPIRKGRPDSGTGSREIHVGRGATPCRRSQYGQVPLPCLHVPRAAHATQRDSGLFGGHGLGSAGAAQQSAL
jgi:two-component system cell cycle sensor histidine kinase PleC